VSNKNLQGFENLEGLETELNLQGFILLYICYFWKFLTRITFMLKFSHLKIRTKLWVMTLITVLSLLFLGGLAIQIVKTSKMLVLLLNSERVVNSTFSESMEDYYKYLLTDNKTYLDSSIINITAANRMTLNFATIDQLLKLPEEKYLGIIYQTYEEGLGYDRKNAALVADRINMIMAIKKEEITKLQQVAASANLLGEQIRTKMLKLQEGKLTEEKDLLVDDLHRMGECSNKCVISFSRLMNPFLWGVPWRP
jgi:hypothetical protein